MFSRMTSLVPDLQLLDEVNGSGTPLPEILGLLNQHYQKSGEPIRLLILADHVVRMALPEISKAVISRILWAYDS